jgi:hypothetical protein
LVRTRRRQLDIRINAPFQADILAYDMMQNPRCV